MRKRQRKKNAKRCLGRYSKYDESIPSPPTIWITDPEVSSSFFLEGYRNCKVEVVSTGSGDNTLTLDMPTGEPMSGPLHSPEAFEL